MDQKEAWKCFENTGSVEAYLLYQALAGREKEPGYDVQSQRDSTSNGSNRS